MDVDVDRFGNEVKSCLRLFVGFCFGFDAVVPVGGIRGAEYRSVPRFVVEVPGVESAAYGV